MTLTLLVESLGRKEGARDGARAGVESLQVPIALSSSLLARLRFRKGQRVGESGGGGNLRHYS